ncbi:methyltransferase-like protein 22 [Cylas formicarius]|uniref:methyltransferase-like protein 22 n=1 Tax=Cylas formicarius TaxID=197179 RepID=UPI002958B5C2|nr:methyltransferase-like protein 22 [Cylas formicarius]
MEHGSCEISSELYSENDYKCDAGPTVNQKNVVSRFRFSLPPESVVDSDGDLVVPRKHSKPTETFIDLEHSQSTNLDLVGLQVWRGSLLLADWLLCHSSSLPEDDYVLELAGGVGLATIVTSMFRPVICTDVNRGEIFDVIRANCARNNHLTARPVEVIELDFQEAILPSKITSLLPKVSTIVAADVIYDDTLTDAFVETLGKLLAVPPKRRAYVALEKRYVFTVADRDCVAPCYDYFLGRLDKLENVIAEQVEIDFPQYFRYDRVKELVLWRISSKF